MLDTNVFRKGNKTVANSIIFASDQPRTTISRRVDRGQLVRLATGVYTTDVEAAPEKVVSAEWHTIVGGLYPDAVITDRSAITGGPVDGTLYLSHEGRDRETQLPGMLIRARTGLGPIEGDAALPGGL